MKPKCQDCGTEDVAVKVVDMCGFAVWFCATDWAAWQEFHERLTAMFTEAVSV